MNRTRSALAFCCFIACGAGWAQNVPTYKAAVVALADDTMLREQFERDLVTAAKARSYDAVTSYDLVPDIEDVADRQFLRTLTEHAVKVVLMLRPVAIGAGSSLESVRNQVSPALLADMRRFARETSESGGDDLIAVVHMAIYLIDSGDPQLISSGAVWLDEPVADRAEGVARLENLVLTNVDAARPAIRQRLGLPALE